MKKYPQFPNGGKVVVEDMAALAQVAGKADDAARVPFGRVFVEGSDRKAWITPVREGPLVVTNGATGKVKVKPFFIHMSPGNATSNAGTEDASGGSETIEDVVSAFYPGGTIDVPVPVPTVTNMRWDLLYAIVAITDSDAATRLVKNPTTKVSAPKSVFTRKKATVTLAWTQGTVSPVATDPYPGGSMPVLPAPAVLQAHAPLAYVNVQYSATPATVAYDKKRIANAPRLWRINQRTGAVVGSSQAVAGKASLAGAFQCDPATIITTASAQGGWDPAAASRPARFIEPMSGAIEMAIPIGPFSTTGGNKTFGTTFAASPLLPVGDPTAGAVLRDGMPVDWRNRVFMGQLLLGNASQKFAWDPAASGAANYQPMLRDGVGIVTQGWGNTIQSVDAFDADMGAGYFVACYFPNVVGGGGDGNSMALIVSKTTGAMYLVAKEAAVPADNINGKVGFIFLRAFDAVGPAAIG